MGILSYDKNNVMQYDVITGYLSFFVPMTHITNQQWLQPFWRSRTAPISNHSLITLSGILHATVFLPQPPHLAQADVLRKFFHQISAHHYSFCSTTYVQLPICLSYPSQRSPAPITLQLCPAL